MEQINLVQVRSTVAKIWQWLSIGIVILMALLLFKSCEDNSLLVSNNDALTKESTSYKLKNGLLVKSVAILQLDKKQLKDQVISKDADLKEMAYKFAKITSVQKTKIKTTIPKIEVALKEPVTIKDIDTITGKLKFERTGAVFEEWYEFGYKVTQDTLTVEPFSTWTEIKRVDGFKRKWFLGRQSLHSDITLTNPFVEVIETKTIVVPIPKAWHETRLFNMLVGGAIMYGITR